MRRAPLRSSRHHWTLSAKMYWTSINSRSWIEPVPPMRDAVIQRKISEIILTGLPLFIRSALNSGRLSWGQTPRPLAGKALQRCGTIDILSSKFAHAYKPESHRVVVVVQGYTNHVVYTLTHAAIYNKYFCFVVGGWLDCSGETFRSCSALSTASSCTYTTKHGECTSYFSSLISSLKYIFWVFFLFVCCRLRL